MYHQSFWPLEWTVAHRPENSCYCKLIDTSGTDGLSGLVVDSVIDLLLNNVFAEVEKRKVADDVHINSLFAVMPVLTP